MAQSPSILVVRLSAIGDLILTAPVTARLKAQGYRVVLLCKDAYRSVGTVLPGVDEILSWEKDRSQLLSASNTFTAILDLQGTGKSKRWCKQWNIPVHTFNKPYVRRALLLVTKSSKLALKPVVDRYLDAAAPLLKGLESDTIVDDRLELPPVSTVLPQAPYIAVVIGGSYAGKRLTYEAWRTVLGDLLNIGMHIALVGGPEEAGVGESLEQPLGSGITNYCGTTTIIEGMAVVAGAALVISGDTGFMHAAANFRKPIISLWGGTHPSLGFAPWPKQSDHHEIISKSFWTPASKHGKVPFWMPNPMKKLPLEEIAITAQRLLKGKTAP
jgi:ADP-heptose:LPS heptosyltransferase